MSQPAPIWSTDVSIRSVCGAGKSLLEELLGQLEMAQWEGTDVFSVHLAVEEALVNAMKHGNRFDESKQVRVACRLFVDRIWIEILDEGAGFDPDQLPDPTSDECLETPCGRGVMLMKNFMSRVEFTDQGKRVVMEKQRGQAE